MQLGAIAVVLCLSRPEALPARPTVNIPGLGSVQGVSSVNETDVSVYMAIPYAKPPVGALRWRAPQPYGGWGSDLLNGTWFGARCMQTASSSAVPETKMSEDCLFLNVATPRSATPASALPVMFWIHGGGYQTGESNDYALDALVARSNHSVVVVTINYRLNVFGFLGGQALAARGGESEGSGNWGIQDQRLALEWVRTYVGAFGGDGSRVTIFGESAGGNSVMNHLAQPASFGLYEAAIIESGAYSSGAVTADQAETGYAAFLDAARCNDTECLQALDAAAVAKAGAAVTTIAGFQPTVDGISLVKAPRDLIDAGQYNNKARVLIGSNRDEYAFWAALDPLLWPKGASCGEACFNRNVNVEPDVLAQLKIVWNASSGYEYPSDLGPYSMWWWMALRVITDLVPGLGACGVRSLARMLDRGGTPAVYAYIFEHPTQADPHYIPGTGPGSVAVPHASEIAYVFGDRNRLAPGAEADLATPVAQYWSSFAAGRSPRAARTTGAPDWPVFTTEGDEVLRIDTPAGGGIRVVQGLRKDACDFADAHPMPGSNILKLVANIY